MPQPDRDSFATELRTLRGDLSLRELGRRAACSKSIISDLEHERRSPTPRIARALDKALGARGKLVSLAEAERHAPDGSPAAAAADDLLAEWDDVWRREFLQCTGAALAAGLAAATSRDLADAHAELRAAHGRLDNLRGAPAVYTQALDHHRQITAWHAAATTAAERRRISALAADTGGFVGFLTYDLGMTRDAAAYYRNAAAHAQQAGDLSCCTNLLGQMSRILADAGHHTSALALADKALHTAGTRAHPAVRSWLHAVRAYHHAGFGDARSARTDLAAAWRLLDRADDGNKPPYIGYLDAAELHKWTGHAADRLGRSTPGVLVTGQGALEEARKAWPTSAVRGLAEVLTSSARIHTALGHRDTAAELAAHAVDIATRTGSARNLRAALASTHT